MADRQGVLGTRSEASNDDEDSGMGSFAAAPTEREAYEEDWYRSLRALAERQQHLVDEHDDPDERVAAEAPSHNGADGSGGEPNPDLGTTEDRPIAQDWAIAPRDAADVLEAPSRPEPPEDAAVSGDLEPPQGESGSAGDGGADFTQVDRTSSVNELRALAEGQESGSPWPDDGPEADPADEPSEPSSEPLAPVLPFVPRTAAEERGFQDGPGEEAEAPEPDEPTAQGSTPSLSSTDPQERRAALEQLAAQELSDAETHRIETLLLDPESDIRRLALQTLAARPDRVEADAIRQALQDPTDDVRAVAVELAVGRGDLGLVAPLLAARDWPLTQDAVLRSLPPVVAASPVDDDVLRKVLDAAGALDPAPEGDERPAVGQLALALGSRRIIEALSWPDVPRLGAIRLLAHDRSPAVLRELASHDGDPLEEIREAAAGAAAELAEAEAARERVERAPAPAGPQPPEEESERIASLASALVDEDGTVRHLALSGLAGMERPSIAAWVRDAIASGDASRLSLAASTAQMLRLVEGAADVLDAAAELPVDARHGLVAALTSFVMPPEQLAGLLGQVRPQVQPEAIRMLWQIGGPPLLPHLRPYLDDPSVSVRQAVLDVFAESGDAGAVEVARVALESDASPIVRARAIRMLAQITTASPPGTIVRALSDPDPEVRATAIETLPDVDGVEAIDALTSSLSDQDDRVRLAAAKRLAARATDPELLWSALRRAPEAGRGDIIASFERVRSGSLTQIALERLRSPEQEERTLAVEVVGWGASPGCVEGAIHALRDPAATVRRAATASLARLRDPVATNALGKALGDPDPEVRVGVVHALGVIDDEAVLGFLVSALNDPDPRVRDVTSQVLTEWSSPAVAKRLAGVLAVPRLREAATDLLTRIGPPAVELLIDVLMQRNPAVAPTVGELLQRIAQPDEFLGRLEGVEPERRLRGVEALGAIGGPVATEALLRSVSDPDERIRARAAQLLADLRHPRAEEALTGLLRDPIPGVVTAAQEALARLGGDLPAR